MIDFILRNAGFIVGLGVYVAIWILLPEVDVWRRTFGSLTLSLTILIAIVGWDYNP